MKTGTLACYKQTVEYADSPVNGELRKFACKRCDVLLQKQRARKSFRAVNRLDKRYFGTYGCCKNSYIHARLGEEIQKKELKRKYMCIVCGDVERDGTVDAPIRRCRRML